ncbi:hypothetical protein KY290_010055 [Solanum tuberosum]|uniref:Uncharacterized protein n=1 Tax=Solanum tuberosum TaxID=4113 RepID=A0ABQ7VYQ3_SOLTU|nr:hypothetical protein KY284_010010 [Solanum tuberosum]KAH0772918.1 hypothetical protein KY290_010055 [Solanum tuberosum]
MFQVVRKLKLLKKELRHLHSKNFQNILTEADEDRERLKQVQGKLQTNPNNIEYQQLESQAYQKFKTSYLAELFLQQRSKATWIRLGDDNTKYLYLVIKHRKLQHATTQLKNRSGLWENDPAEIAKLIVGYYEDILGRKTEHRIKAVSELICQGTTLSEGQQNELIKNFEPSEVKKAMFQIDSYKSLGPDGFGSGFYRAAWSIVGEDITSAVIEFFQNNRILGQINATSIALIP